MDPFDAMLGIVWTVVVIGIAIIVIIYVWAKRYPRWKDSPWWITLIFAIGMAKIVGAIGAILVFGVLNIPIEGASLTKDFLIGGIFAGCAWIINNRRRAKKRISN